MEVTLRVVFSASEGVPLYVKSVRYYDTSFNAP